MRGRSTARGSAAAALVVLALAACGSAPETPPWGRGATPTPEQLGAGWSPADGAPAGDQPEAGATDGGPTGDDPLVEPSASAPEGPPPRFVPCTLRRASAASTHLDPVPVVTERMARSVPGEEMPTGRVLLLHAADLVLPDGRLGGGDGYDASIGAPEGDFLRVGDGRTVAPVTLAVVDSPRFGRRVAFAEVRTGPGRPVAWTLSPDLSIVTDGGDGGFFRAGLPEVVGDEGWIEGYVSAFEAAYKVNDGLCVQRLPQGSSVPESILFPTGIGDGRYPTLIGTDARGRVVSVVHTGYLLAWELSGLPGPKPAGLDF
jgi:hypothetical protein